MNKSLPPQTTVAHVDIPRFMGKWYVIANIPTFLEKGAHNAVETYTWNANKSRIDIDFRFSKDSFTGKERIIAQKAWIYDERSNAEWRVQPIWPLKLAYLVVDLSIDYSDTIVGVPNRNYVWIMAREPQISERRYKELVSKVEVLGYDITKLQLVPQQPKGQNPR